MIVNNVDADDDVKTEDHMPSNIKIVEEDSCGERSNQLGRKPAGKQAQSPAMNKSSCLLVLGIRIRPPARQRKNKFYKHREAINTKNSKQATTFIGCLDRLPCWHLCLAPTGITRTRLFSVDCGSLRQSGPRPDPRFLRQDALEALTRSARMDSPRRTGRKQFSGDDRRRRRV
ncbi:hypothetical protein F511_32161 [Dorcoceras hygrometricum]|uniref:Uncharacterized protein n=1 Tax=Dorcoceras hygrometricum TaxID=472368 RepID=A0A2Z7CUQ3_9LAMI|nr:hypothetical protein F511_32161 [Dorcoceras hygrometricum]